MAEPGTPLSPIASPQVEQTPQTVPPHRQHSSPARLESIEDPFQRLFLDLLKVDGVMNDWKLVGRYLGLPETDIDAIWRENMPNIKESCFKMMKKWKQTQGDQATPEKLIEALEEVGLQNAVAEVKKTFGLM